MKTSNSKHIHMFCDSKIDYCKLLINEQSNHIKQQKHFTNPASASCLSGRWWGPARPWSRKPRWCRSPCGAPCAPPCPRLCREDGQIFVKKRMNNCRKQPHLHAQSIKPTTWPLTDDNASEESVADIQYALPGDIVWVCLGDACENEKMAWEYASDIWHNKNVQLNLHIPLTNIPTTSK